MSLQTILSNSAGLTSAGDIINLLMYSSSHGNHETMQSFLGSTYYRVNPFISENIDLAATDTKTMKVLRAYAEQEPTKRVIKDFAKKYMKIKRTQD